jgi:DNA replication protein DnaC
VLNQPTLDKMQEMRMPAMAEAFDEQLRSSQYAELSFEERLGLLIDAEWTSRQQRKLQRRLKSAKLRYPASLEDLNFRASRGLDRQVVLALGSCSWIAEHHNLILTGPTGTGKTYLACALVERACRSGYSAYYVRAPRLLHDLAIARADGSYGRLLVRLAKTQLLAIDDWLITPLKESQRQDLLEVIEDRSECASTLVATQLTTDAWHAAIGEPTLADAICDRLIHRAHKIELKGPSMRKPRRSAKRHAGGDGTQDGDSAEGV